MKAFFFTNMYLSTIQHSVQSMHCLRTIFKKYDYGNSDLDKEYSKMIHDWDNNYETVIIKNGGPHETMLKIRDLCGQMNLPWGEFREPSLDNALTCIGVIVPERFYDREVSNRFCESWKRSKVEQAFVDMLASTQLAR